MSDMLAMEKSQSYLAAVASRAVIFIESPDPRIGLMAVVAVGMGEVSSCAPSVSEGDLVQAGDEIGCFHYGGSTHCLVFGSHVDLQFEDRVEGKQTDSNMPVRCILARGFLRGEVTGDS